MAIDVVIGGGGFSRPKGPYQLFYGFQPSSIGFQHVLVYARFDQHGNYDYKPQWSADWSRLEDLCEEFFPRINDKDDKWIRTARPLTGIAFADKADALQIKLAFAPE